MRTLLNIINGVATNDGDGVKIHRIAGRHLNTVLDPFLMIDEIRSDDASDYMGGFPEHPHRGFETITYMKVGRMRHRDHMGNEGVIEPGDVQWMTAGRGVLHSEMPEQEEGLLHGFQLWLNLPASEKMKPAAYRAMNSADIPELTLNGGGQIRVIAGDVRVGSELLTGSLPACPTEPLLLDVRLSPDEEVNLQFNKENPASILVYEGRTDALKQHQVGLYSRGETLCLRAGDSGMSALVISGRPLNEPIAQHGPFVMNTAQQIEQTINDYQRNELVSQDDPAQSFE